MKSAVSTPPHLRTLLFCTTLLLFAPGCSQDPAVTVTVEISNIANEDDRETVKEKFLGLIDGSSHQYYSTSTNDRMTIKLSPVTDVESFAKKIDIGQVTDVDLATRTVKVNFTP